MKFFILSFFLLPALAFAYPLRGEFSQIIADVLGEDWAQAQTSYGLAIMDAKSGTTLFEEYVQGDKQIYPASTIKTLIALATLKHIEEKKFSFEDLISINQINAASECKYWDCSLYGPGKQRTIKQLLWDMITISNNLATNQLIDLNGKKFINKMARKLKLSLRIYRKVYDDVNPEPDIEKRNEATARGFVELYREIATGRKGFLREDLRLLLVSILAQQKYHNSLNKHFPASTTFYHKTGNTSKVTGDAGFYFRDDKTVVVMAGLQDFNRYRVCRGSNCYYRHGFWSLAEIGHRTFHMVEETTP